MSKSNNVVPFVVRSSDGSISTAASVAQFTAELNAYKALQESDNEKILAAHNAVVEALGNTEFNFGYLKGAVLSKLNPPPGPAYAEMVSRVDSVVRSLYEPIKKGRGSKLVRLTADSATAE